MSKITNTIIVGLLVSVLTCPFSQAKTSDPTQYEKKLVASHAERLTLQAQLDTIQLAVTETEDRLAKLEEELATQEQEIAAMRQSIIDKQDELAEQKKLLKKYVRLIHHKLSRSVVEVLFTSKTFSQALGEIRNLEIFERLARDIYLRTKQAASTLDQIYATLEYEQQRRVDLIEQLEDEQARIAQYQQGQHYLLEITRGQENKWADLVKRTNRFGELLRTEISELQEKNVVFPQLKDKKLTRHSDDTPLSWPLDPELGISAYFIDEGYKEMWGVDHRAIDLPAYQGSQIYAAETGLVYKAATNNFDYSFIILAHPEQTYTVYGHMSEILVEEGDLISEGELIGLSGGAIGAPGSGPMTTGPHLHFEVHANQTIQDPLAYLPIFDIPYADVPEEMRDRLTDEQVAIMLERDEQRRLEREAEEEARLAELAESEDEDENNEEDKTDPIATEDSTEDTPADPS